MENRDVKSAMTKPQAAMTYTDTARARPSSGHRYGFAHPLLTATVGTVERDVVVGKSGVISGARPAFD